MNAVRRFIVFGAQDADRRVAAMLTPRPFAAADHYIKASVIVRSADRVGRTLQSLLLSSATVRAATLARAIWEHAHWAERYRAVGVTLLMAVVIHVTLTVIQGPRPGWFWLIIPALTLALASMLLAATRTAPARRRPRGSAGAGFPEMEPR